MGEGHRAHKPLLGTHACPQEASATNLQKKPLIQHHPRTHTPPKYSSTCPPTLHVCSNWSHTKTSVQPKLKFLKTIVVTESNKRTFEIPTPRPSLRHLPWVLRPPAPKLKFRRCLHGAQEASARFRKETR